MISQAQGTINFSNLGAGLNLPIALRDGVTKPGPDWTAELLVGPTLNRMESASQTSFISGGSGYFSGGPVTVSNMAPGETAWCVLQVWPTKFGSFTNAAASEVTNSVSSGPFQVVLGGFGSPPSTPTSLTGLGSSGWGSLNIYDEPLPKLGLRPSGSNTLSITWDFFPVWSWRYTLQQTHDPTVPHWTTMTNDFELDQKTLRVTVRFSQSNTFYRLVH